ncbi:hypothetical protein JOD54_005061 [Actinokineospora baliensis]|nr:hypothetical protein [Actinokineospora baliensis]
MSREALPNAQLTTMESGPGVDTVEGALRFTANPATGAPRGRIERANRAVPFSHQHQVTVVGAP